MMKYVLAAVMVVAATAVCAAQPAAKVMLDSFRQHVVKAGGHCTTTCQRIGNQQVCNTYCY